VVPVSWSRLTEVVVPAWVETLLGRRTMASFGEEFAPREAKAIRGWWRQVDLQSQLPASWSAPRYLQDIGWAASTPFVTADRLRASGLHRELERSGLAEICTHALCDAICFSASVELAGADRFEDHSLPHCELFDASHFRWYARLHDAPRCQVAGTKNRYHFLEDLFITTGQQRRRVYDHAARPFVDPALRDLLEALFLSTRAFPGTWVLDRNATWPAADDLRFQGLLAPAEVRRLVPYLDDIAQLEAALDLDEQHELFPLFADRVRRSADQGLALVTLHDGL
jgi:hypothetical protein